MALTNEERAAVIEFAREYPAGIPAQFWGHGPMAGDRATYTNVIDFEEELQRTYG